MKNWFGKKQTFSCPKGRPEIRNNILRNASWNVFELRKFILMNRTNKIQMRMEKLKGSDMFYTHNAVVCSVSLFSFMCHFKRNFQSERDGNTENSRFNLMRLDFCCCCCSCSTLLPHIAPHCLYVYRFFHCSSFMCMYGMYVCVCVCISFHRQIATIFWRQMKRAVLTTFQILPKPFSVHSISHCLEFSVLSISVAKRIYIIYIFPQSCNDCIV